MCPIRTGQKSTVLLALDMFSAPVIEELLKAWQFDHTYTDRQDAYSELVYKRIFSVSHLFFLPRVWVLHSGDPLGVQTSCLQRVQAGKCLELKVKSDLRPIECTHKMMDWKLLSLCKAGIQNLNIKVRTSCDCCRYLASDVPVQGEKHEKMLKRGCNLLLMTGTRKLRISRVRWSHMWQHTPRRWSI